MKQLYGEGGHSCMENVSYIGGYSEGADMSFNGSYSSYSIERYMKNSSLTHCRE